MQYGAIKRNKNTDKLGSKDIILTNNYAIPYQGVNNLNTIIISSVGTGKTRGFLKSNLLQKGCSFVITDTKGDLITEFSEYLKEPHGLDKEYIVKILNLKDPSFSNHYNPFQYMTSEEDVVNFALALSVNVTKNPDDSFWLSASTNLIASMCFFLFETHDRSNRNLRSLLSIYNDYLTQSAVGSRRFKNAYEELMSLMPPTSLAKKFYAKCEADGRTFSNMLASVGQAIAVFEYSNIQELTAYDDIHLNEVGDERMALFINLDDTNPAYDFIAGLIYTQLFRILYQRADNARDYRLHEHVRFFMDDFANYKIPNISHILSTCRSRGISLEMLLQSEAQLRALYGEEADNIIANCAYIYMGSNDLQTQQNIAMRLGKNLKEIQNSVDTTYVFFPEGTTIVDKKADYTTHQLYPVLASMTIPKRKINPNTNYKIGSDEWKENLGLIDSIYDLLRIRDSSHNILDIDSIELSNIKTRSSIYDSTEEEMFHNTLKIALERLISWYECRVHVDLREIFDINTNPAFKNSKLKYKLLLMHCDFIITRFDDIVCGIEIDGSQHADEQQVENDKIKDELFAAASIPLYRITAASVRENCTKEVNKIIAELRKGDPLTTPKNKETKNTEIGNGDEQVRLSTEAEKAWQELLKSVNSSNQSQT